MTDDQKRAQLNGFRSQLDAMKAALPRTDMADPFYADAFTRIQFLLGGLVDETYLRPSA